MSNLRRRNVFSHISKIYSERLCSIRELKMIEACEFQLWFPKLFWILSPSQQIRKRKGRFLWPGLNVADITSFPWAKTQSCAPSPPPPPPHTHTSGEVFPQFCKFLLPVWLKEEKWIWTASYSVSSRDRWWYYFPLSLQMRQTRLQLGNLPKATEV